MVSWDLKVRFFGVSPNIKELVKLAKEKGFSNIESLEYIKDGIHRIVVNDRGLNQTEFKFEEVE